MKNGGGEKMKRGEHEGGGSDKHTERQKHTETEFYIEVKPP